jgi:hypothetical protein
LIIKNQEAELPILFTNIRNPNNISSYYMRGTKKRMMYKKRRDTKMRRRKTTKKMRGGWILYNKNTNSQINYDDKSKKYFDNSFSDWKRQQEEKSNKNKTLYRRFRGMFKKSEQTPTKTDKELQEEFLESEDGKQTISEIENHLEPIIQNTKKEIEIKKIKEIEEIEEKIEKEKKKLLDFKTKNNNNFINTPMGNSDWEKKSNEIYNNKINELEKQLKEIRDSMFTSLQDEDDAEFQGGKKRRTRRKDKRKYK